MPGIIPAGHVAVDALDELAPITFQPLIINVDDDATILADPLINAMLGWQGVTPLPPPSSVVCSPCCDLFIFVLFVQIITGP